MGPLLGAVKILLLAHAMQGTVVGRVYDAETSHPVAGAVVALPELNRTAAADDSGRYVLQGVPPGRSLITVHFMGYAERSLEALVPETGPLEVDFWLVPEPVRIRSMDVHAPILLPGLDAGVAAFPDRVVTTAAMRSDPFLAEQDALQALGAPGRDRAQERVLLRPGQHRGLAGQARDAGPGRPGASPGLRQRERPQRSGGGRDGARTGRPAAEYLRMERPVPGRAMDASPPRRHAPGPGLARRRERELALGRADRSTRDGIDAPRPGPPRLRGPGRRARGDGRGDSLRAKPYLLRDPLRLHGGARVADRVGRSPCDRPGAASPRARLLRGERRVIGHRGA